MSDLREALSNAIEESEKNEAPVSTVSEAAPESTASAGTDIAAASSVDTPDEVSQDAPVKVADSPADGKAVATEASEAKPAETPAKTNRVDRAPASWKGQAKGEWNNVPLAIRQEVHRREMQVERVLNETAPIRQFQQQFTQTVAPFQERMQALGVNPLQAMENFFRVDYHLSSAPKAQRAQMMAKLIKDYDIDFVELDNALVGTTTPQAQQTDVEQRLRDELRREMMQTLSPILQERQQAVEMKRQQVAHTVESMASDPKFPYFTDVREDMADIIEMAAKRNVDMSLEEAYARATRMNPDVYSQMGRQNEMQTANQQHAQAQRARVASSSVTGAPATGGSNSFVGNGSLRGALEAAFHSNRL